MKRILTFALCITCFNFSHAQHRSGDILREVISKVNSLKSLSYTFSDVQKNMFSERDTSHSQTQSMVLFDRNAHIKASSDRIQMGKLRFRKIFKADTLYQADLSDSTYSFTKNPEQSNITGGLFAAMATITYNLNKKPATIFQRKDTIIGRHPCYNLFIKAYDKIEKGYHNYTYYYVFIDKVRRMPVLFIEKGTGIAEKDGHIIGRLSIYNKTRFWGYHLNPVTDTAEFNFDSSKFSPQNSTMLADGEFAPRLNLTTPDGEKVDPNLFQNKILLIEFGATDCGANALANPMVNRLHEKYANKDFAIACLYTGETPRQAKNYINANKLRFPVYLTDVKTKHAYKTVGTPGFYLVGKNGKILMSSNGYSDELEQNLSVKIEDELKK